MWFAVKAMNCRVNSVYNQGWKLPWICRFRMANLLCHRNGPSGALPWYNASSYFVQGRWSHLVNRRQISRSVWVYWCCHSLCRLFMFDNIIYRVYSSQSPAPVGSDELWDKLEKLSQPWLSWAWREEAAPREVIFMAPLKWVSPERCHWSVCRQLWYPIRGWIFLCNSFELTICLQRWFRANHRFNVAERLWSLSRSEFWFERRQGKGWYFCAGEKCGSYNEWHTAVASEARPAWSRSGPACTLWPCNFDQACFSGKSSCAGSAARRHHTNEP